MTNITKTFISPIILTLFIILFIILRIPSLAEPHWYGDEGVYAGVAYAMENGRTLYSHVWDNKPPGIYYLYMFGNPANRLLVIRLLNILAGIISISGVAAIATRLKFQKAALYVALAITVYTLGTPVFEGNIANGENFFLPFVIWGLYFGLSRNLKQLVIGGIIFGAGFWIKFHPLFDMSALGLFIALTHYRQDLRRVVHSLSALGIGFLIPLVILFGYLQYHHTLQVGLQTIFFGNVQYTKVYELPYLTQEIRLLSLMLLYGVAYYLFRSKKISQCAFFILCIFLIEYFSALLSGRRYLHYLIAMIPSISLLSGFTVGKFWQYKHLVRSSILIIIVSSGLMVGWRLFILGGGYLLDTNPIGYYQKYYAYITGSQKYFLNAIEESIDKLRQQVSTRYTGAKIHLNIDNPWYYEQTGIVPTTSFIPAYHQTLRENGEYLYVKEVNAYDPTVIIVEKSSYKSEVFIQYLEENFVKDIDDETFEYYVKRDATLSLE